MRASLTQKPLLHLGCGNTPRPADDCLNCDLYPGPNVDMVFDLMQPWPFHDDTARGIYASHTLEHLPDHFHFFREAWRVLEDGATMTLRVPYGGHRSAWYDPSHLRPWYPESFAFLQPGYYGAIHNPQYDAWHATFYVAQVCQRINQHWRRWLRWWPLRRRLLPWVPHLPDAVEELWATLVVIKQPTDVQAFTAQHQANAVPTRMTMYAHEWYGDVTIPCELVDISGRIVTRAL